MAEGDQVLEARRHPRLLLHLRGRQEGEERERGGEEGQRGGREGGRGRMKAPRRVAIQVTEKLAFRREGGGRRWGGRRDWRREGQRGRKRVREGAPRARRPRQYLPRRPGVRWASEGEQTRNRGDGGERKARETFGRGKKEVDTPT
jgi:hypothetical protein